MNRFKSAFLSSFAVLAVLCLIFASASRAAEEIALKDGWTVQSSAKVTAGGEKVSENGFDTTGWYKTSAPKTVFAVLVENGVYKDPFFGMNLRSVPGVEYPIGGQYANFDMPANSPYAVPWWYRKEFEVPKHFKGRTVWLAFHGINYRGEIWINGKKVAGPDEVVGAFRRYEFDVTPFVHEGSKNVVAVSVTTPKAGELGVTFVDWNPMAPDKEMGLWQEVVLSDSGPLAVRHAFVDTKLDLPGGEKAHLTVRAQLQNATSAAVKGTLRGKITGAATPIEFSQPVELAAKETREVVFSADSVPALNVEKPKLWWPYQMGEPYLHNLSLEFEPEHGGVSDRQTISFGIVQTDSELTPEGYRLFKVNGKPLLVRGAGWTPDMMLRVEEPRREAEFRYVKEMGMNTIRLEGKLEDDAFFDRADKDGILVMAGWCCCDSWEHWNKWGDENRSVSVASLRDQLLRMRQHPSVLVWLNGSDNPPPAEREQAYLDVEKAISWPKPVISSATAKKAEVTGDSGVKMSGPYEYVSPNYWLLDTKAGGAYGFNTETSPGPAVPPLEGLQSMFPPEKMWPMNEFWDFHAGGGKFKDIHVFTDALEQRYGKAKDAADFAWKSQATTYEGERAMFEAYSRNKYKSTGVIQWMLNNAWPGLIWHLYDYSLRPAGGYFGTKKALEPVHAQFSYDDRGVVVVNSTQEAQKGLRIVAKTYDVKMKELFSRESTTDVAADGVSKTFAIPEPSAENTTYFLNLQLYRPTGELLSRNFYWLSSMPDTLDFSKTEWYYTPLTSFADFKALQDLSKATVKASIKTHETGEEAGGHVTVENTGTGLAFLVRLRLLKQKGETEILPVFWEDNYFSLMPGEKRDVAVNVRKTDAGDAKLELVVDGYNVSPVTVHAAK
ncbi:MAG TPA: glycoside hydrolase family 2 protein [Candidatus Acidoferrum sp.]|jgi:exo-1,4-beta-D-glucosaminidase